ncbi:hypothetical protein NPIL_76601 [Nephila pilipes]|uniref:Uncharacterized protein n=1 Tax=Nephila pilipes TaxID=299642 RepID=A0A8X6UEV9_NEPPI|nr:hypothetical protein NPIL_76601 [Nephila pilipes]
MLALKKSSTALFGKSEIAYADNPLILVIQIGIRCYDPLTRTISWVLKMDILSCTFFPSSEVLGTSCVTRMRCPFLVLFTYLPSEVEVIYSLYYRRKSASILFQS